MRFSRRALLAAAATPLPAALTPGAIRFKWNHGSVCAATNRDPRIQVVAYNQDTLILRENIAIHWEAPFTYLLAGTDRACLIDTGASPESRYYPLRATVDGLLRRLASFRNKPTLPLTVVHTSGEDVAQNQGVRQFENRPDTTIVPLSVDGRKRHFGFSAWPQGKATIDLGGRTLTVLPTPGTHKDGLSFYDSATGHLFTGDLLFPGRILISNDTDYIASLARLEAFAAAQPVRWLLGGHIEMSATPGVQYSTRTTFKANERVLQLEPEVIGDALLHARRLQGQLQYSIRPEFILFNRIGPDERGDWPADIPTPPVTVNLR